MHFNLVLWLVALHRKYLQRQLIRTRHLFALLGTSLRHFLASLKKLYSSHRSTISDESKREELDSTDSNARIFASQLPPSAQQPRRQQELRVARSTRSTASIHSLQPGDAVVDIAVSGPSSSSLSLASQSRVPTPVTQIPLSLLDGNFKNRSYHEVSKVVENLVAVSVGEFERYERDVKLDKIYSYEYNIEPLSTSFCAPPPPQGWAPHIHPEGALYFYDRTRDVLTDAYLYDEDVCEKIEHYIGEIFAYINTNDIRLPPDTQLVLELRKSGRCGYYFADHTHRCIFWLDEFDGLELFNEVHVPYTLSHIGSEMLSQYWYHNDFFPDIRPLPEDAAEELEDTLIHAVGDSLTSEQSTAPYTLDVLQNMLSLVSNTRSIFSTDPLRNGIWTNERIDRQPGAGTACILYRLMATFAHERFLNLHGEKAARLNKDQSIHPKRERTIIMKITSPFLLFGPQTYLDKLEKMSVDSLVNKPSWGRILLEMTEEWKEFTLYATVLLNANVAFLAIQSVDDSANGHGRSTYQRASYFSIVTSLGTIIVGLLLVRQHYTSLNMSFLANRSASSIGLETLSIMYSLPYALLMWGMVSFLVAFSLMAFSAQDTVTEALIGSSWSVLVVLLLWCLSASFEKDAYFSPWPVRQWQALTEIIRRETSHGWWVGREGSLLTPTQ